MKGEMEKPMNINDLITIYQAKKTKYGAAAYRHITNVLKEAKKQHEQEFKGVDHEQSWKVFKGNALEGLILYIMNDEITNIGLKIVKGKKFERTKPENLPTELKHVKKNLSIDFGKFGFHIPDVDLVIYDPKTYKVVAVLSSKVTLRERIAQTAYWKLKMKNYELTKHVKVYFITPDEDGTLTIASPAKKGRAIVETDTDGSYVLSETDIEESSKVKMFDKFIDDLKSLLAVT